jgi:hypothetical protein
MLFTWYGILIVQYLIGINAKWVIDVDSSIINEINQNPSIGYLIQFHAPWFVFLTKFLIFGNSYLGVDIVNILNLFMKK